MSNDTLIRVRHGADHSDVLVLVKHPMETGQRRDGKTGDVVPARYIQTMRFTVNDREVARADLGPAVATNPLTGIRIPLARSGDTVSAYWADSAGRTGSAHARIE